MSNVTTTFRGQAVLLAPTTPTIYNVAVPLANTEVSQALSGNAQNFTIRARGFSRIRLAFAAGQSGTKFITIPKGCSLTQETVNYAGVIYFQSDKAGETVEILEWV